MSVNDIHSHINQVMRELAECIGRSPVVVTSPVQRDHSNVNGKTIPVVFELSHNAIPIYTGKRGEKGFCEFSQAKQVVADIRDNLLRLRKLAKSKIPSSVM